MFLQSEVKIIHIIVQNNTYYSARSRWTKQQQCKMALASLCVLQPVIFHNHEIILNELEIKRKERWHMKHVDEMKFGKRDKLYKNL